MKKRCLVADTHMHTIASGHAYCTIGEMAHAASEKGLAYIAITDHGCAMTDGLVRSAYFRNQVMLPDFIEGVGILRGIEANIINYTGELDLEPEIQEMLDWVIASLHDDVVTPEGISEHTDAWLAAAENPHIDVMGHMGNPRFPFSHRPVIKRISECDKIVEINTSSEMSRPGSYQNCRDILQLCAEFSVPVVINSDAHHSSRIGDRELADQLAGEIAFPDELFINIDLTRFEEVCRRKAPHLFIDAAD